MENLEGAKILIIAEADKRMKGGEERSEVNALYGVCVDLDLMLYEEFIKRRHGGGD